MAQAVHLQSLDEDTRRFVPDEVFETEEEAAETLEFLIGCYTSREGPLVYPVLLKDGTYIGYVQAVPFDGGTYEIGYHIGRAKPKQGDAAEAVSARHHEAAWDTGNQRDLPCRQQGLRESAGAPPYGGLCAKKDRRAPCTGALRACSLFL